MTRQDAIEYDNWLKSGLMQEAEVLGLGEKAGSDLADRYITVIPDDERTGDWKKRSLYIVFPSSEKLL